LQKYLDEYYEYIYFVAYTGLDLLNKGNSIVRLHRSSN